MKRGDPPGGSAEDGGRERHDPEHIHRYDRLREVDPKRPAVTKSHYSIALITGDGIGPEIVPESQKVLKAVEEATGIRLDYVPANCGDRAKQETGEPVPQESLKKFMEADACLKGPVGESVMDVNMAFRFNFDLYGNVRPARSYPAITPPALRPDINLVVIRENSEGFYRALENQVTPDVWTCTGVFTRRGMERICRFSFEYARRRLERGEGKGRVALAHKANIFRSTHGLFRDICREVSKEFPQIAFKDFYADAVCALLVREPQNFDVIVAENLIADLLSDLAGQVAGGLGMTAGTNMNYETGKGYFEPTHGSAPDIAGTGRANPIGQIRSAGLMLEFLGMIHKDERCLRGYTLIESAVSSYLSGSERRLLPMELDGEATTQKVGDVIASKVGQGL